MEALQQSEPTEHPDPVAGRNWGLLLVFAVLLQAALFRAGGLLWTGRSSGQTGEISSDLPGVYWGDRASVSVLERTSGVVGRPPHLKIQLNLAEQHELEILPRIGPQLAARIVEYRNQHYPVTNVSQLLEVSGIGPKRFKEIAGYLDVSRVDELR